MSGRSDPALVVCDTRLVPTFPEISTLEPGQVRQAWPVACPAQAHICGGSEPAYALFTSGTTGAPKLCFHSHGDPLVYNEAFARRALGLGPGHITLSVSKAYFAYGLGNSLFFPLLSGAAAVLEPELPTAEKVLTAIGRYGVRVLFGVPSFYARLVAHTQAQVLGSVSIAVCAGEVLPGLVEERMDALAGPVLLNGIGSTEVGQTFASNTVSARRRHSVGRALAPTGSGWSTTSEPTFLRERRGNCWSKVLPWPARAPVPRSTSRPWLAAGTRPVTWPCSTRMVSCTFRGAWTILRLSAASMCSRLR